MINRKSYTPYIRRYRRSDKTQSFRTAGRLVMRPKYVLVQRVARVNVLACGDTKREILEQLPGVLTTCLERGGDWKRPRLRDFRVWASGPGKMGESYDR